jgi:CO/xanthine dehydrogenase Mo-binding subunit
MWETVKAIQESEHWKSPQPGPNRGRGVASGFWFNVGLKSSVTATVNADGKVALVEGSTDIGGTRASIAMQLAETLGIAAEDVVPTVADTDGIGYTDVTGGSRVTYATGWAAYEAGLDIQRQMVERAALLWDASADKVRYEDGRVIGPGDKSLSFKELAAELDKTGEPIIGRGSSAHNEPGGAFATHLVDVEVDPDTGKVQILRYTASQDAGTAIHPSYVEGQMQGGTAQGIGWALNEEYFYDASGVMRNSTRRISTIAFRRASTCRRSTRSSSRSRIRDIPTACAGRAKFRSCRRRQPLRTRSSGRSACGCSSCRCRRRGFCTRFWRSGNRVLAPTPVSPTASGRLG